MRFLAAGIALVLVSTFALALAEPGDYPDDCEGYAVAEVGEPVTGALVPPDDVADHVGLNVTEDHVGHRINVTYVGDTHHVELDVYTPDCGQNVVPVPHQACEKAQCPKGHDNGRGKGHELCMGKGHVSECSGSEGGESGEDYVSFVPTEAGVYVVVLSVDTATYRCHGDDCHVRDPKDPGDDRACVDLCEDGAGTSSTDDGATIQSCHFACEGDSFSYALETSDDTLVR